MASRKETPDLLGELLGGGASLPRPAPKSKALLEAEPEPGPAEKSRSATGPLEEAQVPPGQAVGTTTAVWAEPARNRSAPRRQAPTKRPSWEYVEIIFCDHGGYRPRYINGLESKNWKKAPLLYDYLNHLGGQGWELAGIGGQHKGRMPAYLKRLKL